MLSNKKIICPNNLINVAKRSGTINVKSTNTLIGHRQIYASSMGEGKTAIEKQKKSNAVEEIKKLSEQILLELK